MFRTVPLSTIRSFSLYIQQWYMSHRFADSSQAVYQPVWRTPLLCAQWKTPDGGQRNCPKHVEFHSKNKFEKLVHLVGFITRTVMQIFLSVYILDIIVPPPHCPSAITSPRGKGTKRESMPVITKFFIDHFVTRFNPCRAITIEVWINTFNIILSCRFCVGFVVVDKEVPGHVFLRIRPFSPVSISPWMHPTHPFILTLTLYNISSWLAAPRHTLTAEGSPGSAVC